MKFKVCLFVDNFEEFAYIEIENEWKIEWVVLAGETAARWPFDEKMVAMATVATF